MCACNSKRWKSHSLHEAKHTHTHTRNFHIHFHAYTHTHKLATPPPILCTSINKRLRRIYVSDSLEQLDSDNKSNRLTEKQREESEREWKRVREQERECFYLIFHIKFQCELVEVVFPLLAAVVLSRKTLWLPLTATTMLLHGVCVFRVLQSSIRHRKASSICRLQSVNQPSGDLPAPAIGATVQDPPARTHSSSLKSKEACQRLSHPQPRPHLVVSSSTAPAPSATRLPLSLSPPRLSFSCFFFRTGHDDVKWSFPCKNMPKEVGN